METSIEIVVRSTELDVLGHVNNAKYLEYMEWGRIDWYEKAGLSWEEFTNMGMGTVTVNININFRKEARLGDELIVKTRPLRRGNTSFVLLHEIFHVSGQKIADAEVTSVAMDLRKRTGMPLPEILAKYFLPTH